MRTHPRQIWRLAETYEILAAIQRSQTLDDICSSVLGYAAEFGAKHLLAGIIPPPGSSRREQVSHVLLDAWPGEWSQRYFSNGYLFRDPTIRLVTRGGPPFLWSEVDELCKISSFSRRVMEEATEFQLREGLTVPFSTVERQGVGLSFAGEKFDLDPYERLTLQLIAAYSLGCAIVLAQGRPDREPVQLSPRQYDVLHWVSEGLTVNEIADRLNISTHTADMHLRAVRERLGVTSSVHAVAEAFRLGLIT